MTSASGEALRCWLNASEANNKQSGRRANFFVITDLSRARDGYEVVGVETLMILLTTATVKLIFCDQHNG